jgi:hypothetical protein
MVNSAGEGEGEGGLEKVVVIGSERRSLVCSMVTTVSSQLLRLP